MFTRRIRHEKSRISIYDWFSFLQLRNELVKMSVLNEKRFNNNISSKNLKINITFVFIN